MDADLSSLTDDEVLALSSLPVGQLRVLISSEVEKRGLGPVSTPVLVDPVTKQPVPRN